MNWTIDRMVWVVVLFGAALIFGAGCSRPLDTAIATSNAAAVGLTATHTELMAHRKQAEIDAAKRVKGPRSDPSVRAEQKDRARQAGLRYRKAFEIYRTARKRWALAAAAIKVAKDTSDQGGDPPLSVVTGALVELARAQQRLEAAAHELTGGLGVGPPSVP